MTEYAHRDCPSCGATSADAEPVIAAKKPAEGLPFEELALNWRGFRKDNVFFSYSRCRSCGLLYCPIYFTDEQLHLLYSSMGDNTAGEDTGTLARTQHAYVKALDNEILQGRWLDLGADIGLCATELRRTPSVTHVDAVEPNLEVHTQLQSALGAAGRIHTRISTTSVGEYQGVIAVHVLDHLKELRPEIEQIRVRLSHGGVLTAVVHNEKSLLRKMLGRKWPPFCLQHPQLFNQRSLGSVLSSVGLRQVNLYRTTNWFSLRHLGGVAGSILGLPKRLTGLAPEVPIPLKLGNIQIVAQL